MAQVSMIALMICSWVLHFEMMVWWLRRFISFLEFRFYNYQEININDVSRGEIES
jgi:hypothetical protein